MREMIKRLSPLPVIAAIAFLLIQVICDLYIPTMTADMVNNGIIKGDTSYIWQLGVIMILISLGGFAAALLNTNISARISYKLGCGLRNDIYRKASQFSNDEFDKIGTSSLITRNTNDVTQVQNLIEMFLKFLVLAPLYLIGGVVMAYRLNPSLSTVFIIIVPIVAITAIGISMYANPLYEKIQKTIDRLNLIFREGLNGVKVIRAFGKEKQEFERYEQDNNEYTKTSIRVNAIIGLLMPIMSLIMSLATIAITWIGGKAIDSGNMEIGTMMGVISYSAQIMTGFMLITNVISSFPRGMTSAKRINEILDMTPSICDAKSPKQTLGQEVSLTFDKVSYCYQGAEKNAIQDISFSIRKGKTLAIIGSTGSGKSTIVNMISRFYDVGGGKVLLNGTDIRDVAQSTLHDRVSLVPQKSALFFGTIRENMQLGKPAATDEEIWAALEAADAAEFVNRLDGGLDGVVEKSGGNFSGGQKQRLCIARAILKSADVYVFDDSFSALDFKTDAKIRMAMKNRLKNAVTVLVAQRISTIMEADKILVLNEGKIAGVGTHDELKQSSEVYREIIASQLEKGEVA
jgi:ABC-type multidrug transport system fused ATPase/permease subunit